MKGGNLEFEYIHALRREASQQQYRSMRLPGPLAQRQSHHQVLYSEERPQHQECCASLALASMAAPAEGSQPWIWMSKQTSSFAESSAVGMADGLETGIGVRTPLGAEAELLRSCSLPII